MLANTRPEWTLSSFGISGAGGVVVPIYPTNSPGSASGLLAIRAREDRDLRGRGPAAKIEQVRDQLPELEHVIGIEAGGGEISLEQLRERGRERDPQRARPARASVAPTTLTRSSTRRARPGPQGRRAQPRQRDVRRPDGRGDPVRQRGRDHVPVPAARARVRADRAARLIRPGHRLVYCGGDPRQIIHEIMETKPSYLPSVPRIFEKLYAPRSTMQARRATRTSSASGRRSSSGSRCGGAGTRRGCRTSWRAVRPGRGAALRHGARAVRGKSARRCGRRADRGRRSSSSSTPAGFRCSRAGA